MIVVPVQGNEEIFSLSCTETLGGVNEGVVKRNPLKDLAFRGLYNQKICFCGAYRIRTCHLLTASQTL